MQKETIATHYGYDTKAGPGATAVPIYQTTAYDFGSAETAAMRFALEAPGHVYTRLGNPTTDVLESRIAALEEGSASIVTASDRKFSRSGRQYHHLKESLRWHDDSLYAHV